VLPKKVLLPVYVLLPESKAVSILEPPNCTLAVSIQMEFIRIKLIDIPVVQLKEPFTFIEDERFITVTVS
jgi:hypothetical protein